MVQIAPQDDQQMSRPELHFLQASHLKSCRRLQILGVFPKMEFCCGCIESSFVHCSVCSYLAAPDPKFVCEKILGLQVGSIGANVAISAAYFDYFFLWYNLQHNLFSVFLF